ncbi:MMPL family transporter [Streptomyces sp. CT34]|uniref:MMPL family transporter n=1 Tax=Streptomyces sp. CT34 TaxID=1553907 RepID=UPI00068C75C6|nr:MMPL family transporter [Streptomyces sp. CT34]
MSLPNSPSGPGSRRREGALGRLGEWCARHALVVLALWLVALAGVQMLQRTFGGEYSDHFSLPGVQSTQGRDVLARHDPKGGPYISQVVLHDGARPLTAVGGQIDGAVPGLRRLPYVLTAQSPLPPPGSPPKPAQGPPVTRPLSADGRTGYIAVRFRLPPVTLGTDLVGVDRAVAPLRAAGVQVEYGGALGQLARPATDDRLSEAIGFAVAILVLLAGFGSVLAAGVPLLAALIAVSCGLGCLGLLAAAFTLGTVSPTLATMIGLGVGIDYALLLITRHRQHLMDGADPAVAAGRTVATGGRAVLVSGVTVVVALTGLSVSGVGLIGKLGMAAAVTVITAVLCALTLVPALLGLLGRGIDRFRVRRPIAESRPATGGATPVGRDRYAQRVARRPWWYLVGGVVVVAVLSVPVFSMRLGHIGNGAGPTSATDRRAFDLMSSAFGPGSTGPLTLVVDRSEVPQADRPALAEQAQRVLGEVPGAAAVTPLRPTPDGAVLTATAYSDQAPQQPGTTALVDRLVHTVLPKAVRGYDAHGYVTGTTAGQVDFLDVVAGRLPLIMAVVVALAFLIILIVFRGVLVAVKAAVLNILSIAASYGVVVAVFQWGWGGPALGVSGTVPIESYVPMMMFAIVFGLSMDYEIFLLSRVHETWLRTADSRASVAHALEITARVITCAALIMVGVFAAFLLSDSIVVKMLGLGLAVSVLIDATVVRLLLMPAVLTLLGPRAWWTPRWLDRVLPHVAAEGQVPRHPSPCADRRGPRSSNYDPDRRPRLPR